MRFWLGTHETSWLARLDVPLFVSHRRLARRRRLPVARGPWALDSGGFTELDAFGGWRTTVSDYVAAVARYSEEIGQLAWAAPMDWMCEPRMLAKTGLSVHEHQERTVANYLAIRERGPFIPVLQGWALADYERCADLYEEAGVDLSALPLVGVGSVCRRQSTDEIGRIMLTLHGRGLRLHGFGVKQDGIARYGRYLASADSMAWSTGGRQEWHHHGRKMCGGHPEHIGGKSCANCLAWAQMWRQDVLTCADAQPSAEQLALFESLAWVA